MTGYRIEPDGTRVVALAKPIMNQNGEEVTEIRLRPPIYKDFMHLGDPCAIVFAETAAIPQDDLAVIRGYVAALADVNELLIEKQVDLAGAIALRDAVKSFFLPASASTSATLLTPSPSPQVSTLATSS